MGLLGDFLESFYGNVQEFRSVHAVVRRERIETSRGTTSRRRPIGREKPCKPKTLSVSSEFWAILPDHARVDATRTKDGDSETTVEIVKGGECFKRTADGNVEVDSVPSRQREKGGSLPTDFRRHFDRSLIREFFASLVLEDLGACKATGRDCVQIRAVPIPGDSIWPHWLPSEADEFHFAADLEFPSLLSIVGKLDGKAIETIEVVQVEFNEAIDESVFDCQPTPGQAVRKAEPVTQPITIEAAIVKVPFTVLLPKSLPADGDPHVHYEPGKRRSSGESLSVMYVGDSPHSFWFHLRADRDPELDERLEWEEVEASGHRFEVSDPQVDGGMIVLRFCQGGTWVEVISDHALNDLFDIAMSFEPVER